MRERLFGFFDALRAAGLSFGPAETIDACRAVALVGVEREPLRESLAASLVKDEAERPTFDEVFDRYFRLPSPGRKKKTRPEGEGEGKGGSGRGRGGSEPRDSSSAAGKTPEGRPSGGRDSRAGETEKSRRSLLARERVLRRIPFEEMSPREVEEAEQLVAVLATRWWRHWSRRRRRRARGSLDFRRTIRRATTRGGVPVELRFRGPRPDPLDLVALVDLSYSVRTASGFLLSLLAPAERYFRRTTFLGYVDEPVELSFERGYVVPHSRLDLAARSDFGRVLERLGSEYDGLWTRQTILLVLGDARNNRRPPRADLLARMRERVRQVVWLVPELPHRWNTGDSVLASYTRHVDLFFPAYDLASLERALRRAFRPV
ncbi:MAG: hypothetical protein KatS3mg076_1469 [Candidatus Binatia bacterium]|nr:MAG: hypothetical protein KatS3mg076_1469 [Candidatus Binatia bacterium]